MSVRGGPKIVSDNLGIYFNAASIKSYPRTGNAWYNLAENRFNADIRGNILFSGNNLGGFDYPTGSTSDYMFLPVGAFGTLPNSSEWTLQYWMKINSSNASVSHFNSIAKAGVDNLIIFRMNTDYTSDIYNFNFLKTAVSGSFPRFGQNEYLLYTVVNTSGYSKIYKNDKFACFSSPVTGISEGVSWVLNQDQDTISGGFDATQSLKATFYQILFYRSGLSDIEVANNFNAFKGRFNL